MVHDILLYMQYTVQGNVFIDTIPTGTVYLLVITLLCLYNYFLKLLLYVDLNQPRVWSCELGKDS